jgi:iron complex transport system substrate-binding protein
MTKTIERPGTLLPEIDDATRREFLVGAAGLLMLAPGCSGSGQSGEGKGSKNTRTVHHELGTTEVPINPERIVVTSDRVEFDSLLVLGRKPTAAGILYEQNGFMPWTKGHDTAGIETFPSAQTGANVEKIAAYRPDLVLLPARQLEAEVFDQLSQLAPTVATTSQQVDNPEAWRDALDLVAECVGETDRVPALAEEVDERLAAVRERVRGLGLSEVSLVAPYAGQGLFVFGGNSPQGLFLKRLDFTRPEAQRRLSGDGSEQLSLERLDEIDADLLLVMEYDPAAVDELEELELFRQLDAVREGRYARMSAEIADASYFQSALSLPWAAEELIGAIEGVV